MGSGRPWKSSITAHCLSPSRDSPHLSHSMLPWTQPHPHPPLRPSWFLSPAVLYFDSLRKQTPQTLAAHMASTPSTSKGISHNPCISPWKDSSKGWAKSILDCGYEGFPRSSKQEMSTHPPLHKQLIHAWATGNQRPAFCILGPFQHPQVAHPSIWLIPLFAIPHSRCYYGINRGLSQNGALAHIIEGAINQPIHRGSKSPRPSHVEQETAGTVACQTSK